MLVERWQRIESLFLSALEKPPAERASFLDHACSTDHALRREVESLLAHESLAAGFLESGDSPMPTAEASPRALLSVGESIGPYSILELVGAGGMGEVYKAYDQRLQRNVAIKFLSHRFAADAASFQRFEREARAASSLSHPNICTVHDMGELQGRPYLVMELLEGQSLKDRIAGSALATGELASISRQVCAALHAAHEKGIVHRDIKPANIFLNRGGQVKVLDFGLAKRDREFSDPVAHVAASTLNPTLTSTGTVMGTLAYMSPEQAVGAEVDVRGDIFSLGVVMYEMASGRLPFRGKTTAGILGSILTESPLKPSSICSGVPAKLDRIILKALEKNPANRYASAAELSAALEPWLHSRRMQGLPWMAAAFAAIALSAVFVAGNRMGRFSSAIRTELTPRQVTANPVEDPIMQAALSPDGTTVAYGDFSGIHLRRIDSGETRLIPPPKDFCFR